MNEGRAFVYQVGERVWRPHPRLDRGEQSGGRRLRLLGGDGGGRERRRVRRRDRRRGCLRQRPDGRGSRIRLPRLGVSGPGHHRRWTAESEQAAAPLRHLGGDGGGRERRRLLGRHRRRLRGTTTGRRTRAGPSSTTARQRGSRRPPPGRRSRTRPSAFFGYSVATAGDVNGDGYSDVIVGALFYDNGRDRRGAGVRLPRVGGGTLDDRRLDGGVRTRTALTSATRWRRRGT